VLIGGHGLDLLLSAADKRRTVFVVFVAAGVASRDGSKPAIRGAARILTAVVVFLDGRGGGRDHQEAYGERYKSLERRHCADVSKLWEG